MPPMTCYVVTSLENRAREELALRDVEELLAGGAFDAADGAGEADAAVAGTAGEADAFDAENAADVAVTGADAAAGGRPRGCVLIAANPMAAAEELAAALDPRVPVHIFDARVHLSFAEHVMLALSKRYAPAARAFSRKLKPVLVREVRALLGRAREELDAAGFSEAEAAGGGDAGDCGAGAGDADSRDAGGGDAPVSGRGAALGESSEFDRFDRIVFLEACHENLVHVFSAAGLPVDVTVHEGLPGELGAIRQAQRLLGFEAGRVSGISARDARLSEEAGERMLDGVLSATLCSRRATCDEAGFHFSGSISVKGPDGLGALQSLRMQTSDGHVLFDAGGQPGQGAPDSAAAFALPFTMRFDFTIDAQTADSLPLGAKLLLCYSANGMAGRSFIRYCRRDFGKFATGRVGRVLVDSRSGLTCFLVQSDANFCQLISRKTDASDSPAARRKIRLAWLLSKVLPCGRKIVLWEKFCARYEESARRVYERLVDEGDGRARFILDGDVLDREAAAGRIPSAYRGQIARRCSFAHYRFLFSARTFIGTETLSHLIGMHSSSRLLRRHAKSARFNYVFLQHGVMYMVTLGSGARDFFSSTSSRGLRRVVVSSELEKEHFLRSGGYRPEQMYVCGLPKYDANAWDADADLIAVMPTWRPWEVGGARSDFTETSYYRFIMGIYEAIPKGLRGKLRVLVHPRFKACMRDSDSPLMPCMVGDTPYDEVLRHVKLLVTDYSSIAYDAFYRGANVVFDWEELDECMREYGPGTHLMLTRDLAFGEVYDGESAGVAAREGGGADEVEDSGGHGGSDFAYGGAGDVSETEGAAAGAVRVAVGAPVARPRLRAMIERAYSTDQDQEHLRRYRQIVGFHDGKNTERLMQMMRADGIV